MLDFHCCIMITLMSHEICIMVALKMSLFPKNSSCCSRLKMRWHVLYPRLLVSNIGEMFGIHRKVDSINEVSRHMMHRISKCPSGVMSSSTCFDCIEQVYVWKFPMQEFPFFYTIHMLCNIFSFTIENKGTFYMPYGKWNYQYSSFVVSCHGVLKSIKKSTSVLSANINVTWCNQI